MKLFNRRDYFARDLSQFIFLGNPCNLPEIKCITMHYHSVFPILLCKIIPSFLADRTWDYSLNTSSLNYLAFHTFHNSILLACCILLYREHILYFTWIVKLCFISHAHTHICTRMFCNAYQKRQFCWRNLQNSKCLLLRKLWNILLKNVCISLTMSSGSYN